MAANSNAVTTPLVGSGVATYGAPVFNDGMTFKEYGQTGLRQYSGWLREEFLNVLQGRQAARIYREMQDNNATIGAMLFAITQTMRKIQWRVKAANATPEALAEAQFADSLRFDCSHTWQDFITEALSMLGYGYSAFEIVYKRRLGRQPDAAGSAEETPSSQFDDGRIGVRKLSIRGQDTVIKWFFGTNGEVLGLTQQPFTGQIANIPIEKMLLFRASSHKNNPEGRSILRNSYRSWFFLKRFEEEEAIFYERMSGVPVMMVPQALMDAAASGDTNAQAQVDQYKRLVTNTKIGEQMGLLLPSDAWPNSTGAQSQTRMFEFQLVTPATRGGTIDSDKIISRHRLDMLMSVMADFIALGHASHGTQSLAENKVDMFFQAIEGWISGIAAVVNRYLLPRVWALNGLDPGLMPEYMPDLAQRIDIAALGDFVLKLAQSGMQMFPDPDLENYLRDASGLPDLADTAYAWNANTTPDSGKTSDLDVVTPRPATPHAAPVTVPTAEAEASGRVIKPGAVIKAMLEAGEARRQRRHR